MMGKKKIGILGGSFNPPHNGHLEIAKLCLEGKLVEKVYFMPAFIQPFKQELKTLNANDRLNLALNLAKEDKDFSVIDYEIKAEGISYTYKTLSTIRDFEEFKDTEIYFILGSDTFKEIRLWYESEKLLREFSFIVAGRRIKENVDFEEFINELEREYQTKVITLNNDFFDVSSTEIREMIKNNKVSEIKNSIPESVLRYISENNLYRD